MTSLAYCFAFFCLVIVAKGVPLSQPSSPTNGQDDSQVTTTVSTNDTIANGNVDDNSASNETVGLEIIRDHVEFSSVEIMIAETMLKQCDDQFQPALNFYECVENSTSLPAIWGAMGLNATRLKIRTISIITITSTNVTREKNVDVTISEDNSNGNDVTSIQGLIQMISAQVENFCGSVESLLNCFEPYLSECFPDPEEENDVLAQGDQQTLASSTAPSPTSSSTFTVPSNLTSPNSSIESDDETPSTDAADQDDNDSDVTFFDIPMLDTQSAITAFVRQTLQLVCANNAAGFKQILESTPCIMNTFDFPNCDRMDKAVSDVDDLMAANNVTGPNPLFCSAMENAAECHLDLTAETCGQNVADFGHGIYNAYFQAITCVSDSNNVVPVRQPFNKLVL